MLPSVVAREVIASVRQQLHAQFPSSTAGFLRDDVAEGVRAAIDDLLDEPNQVFRGPYLNIGLPFQVAGSDEELPFSHLSFDNRPYRHQMRAFTRLCGGAAQPTLVATGTGSGKTECFLFPLLEHCAESSSPGIKALVIYPMNALAQDQARRFAEEVHAQSALRGKVRVGLYTGDTGEKGKGSRSMSEHAVITNRSALQQNPPDILLTNYKMLDFLLIRPRDRQIWQHNTSGTLRYLVVDELHTFDGAQGSDLACLVRRLRDRLECGEELACIGTSATVGDDAEALTKYASDVFATPFGEDSVLREERESLEEFLPAESVGSWPDKESVIAFSRLNSADVDNYLEAASELWLGESLPAVDDIGDRLLQVPQFRDLLQQAVDVAELSAVVAEQAQRLRVSQEVSAHAIDALIALACAARNKGRPWLTVRVQLWLRELRRMVATVGERPEIQFHADLADDRGPADEQGVDGAIVLPVVHCNDCHATGWLARKPAARNQVIRDPNAIYDAFFGNKPDAINLYPASAPPGVRKHQTQRLFTCCGAITALPKPSVDSETQEAPGTDCQTCGAVDADFIDVVLPEMTREVERRGVKRVEFQRDCPYCEAQGSLLILGARAASLSSVAIGHLQQSPFNGDQKLIAFSDSVQDAAHRAGFFAARTYTSVIRYALAATVRERGTQTLAELLDNFGPAWRQRLADPKALPKSSPDADFVATFLAPDQYWRDDWEELKANDRLSPGSSLVNNYVLPRLRWEALVAFGFESRRGRTLERTGQAAIGPEQQRLADAIEWAHPRIVGELAELASLDVDQLHQLAVGVLWTLRTRGALHDDMLEGYLHSKGSAFDLTNRRMQTHLRPMGRQSRLPRFLSLQYVGPQFDAIDSGRAHSWYRQWFDKLAGQEQVTASSVLSPFYRQLLAGMTRSGLLLEHEVRGHAVWSLNPEAFIVSTEVETLVCDSCGHRVQVTQADSKDWQDLPCIRAACHGTQQLLEKSTQDGHSLSHADAATVTPVRINAAEHTAVLASDTRAATERSFKRNPGQPWDINLLSATPTMEMGVDIGALSSVLLCSVPPAQANYLQRIGRAGRKDGNAFNLTIANGQPHDLYHFAEPLEMMRGAVQPPGVFIGAIAVLERQLVAFCFDRWVQTGIEEDAIPSKLRTVLDAVDAGSATVFPNNLFAFIETERSRILRDFLNIFEDYVTRAGENELSDFVQGAYASDGSRPGLVRRLKDLFDDQTKQRKRFNGEISTLKSDLERRKKQPEDEAQKTAIAELEAELSALKGLLTRLNRQNTLNFLTDQGVLPNYAFPEEGVTLKSVIYRRVTPAQGADGASYKNIEFEVRRPAQVALRELAPFSRFYGNSRSVEIDQVTLGAQDQQVWRLCPSCNHGENVDLYDAHEVCPRCSDPRWRAAEQKLPLLRLREVHARASDSDSRIGDDADDREPVMFNRQFLFDIDPENIERGWRFTDENCPFGFEYLSRSRFREINFGRERDSGSAVRIAGKEANRPGFRICTHCGKVDTGKGRRGQSLHARRCPWFDREDEIEEAAAWKHMHLFRELESEAVRLLLPIADIAQSRLRLESFTAALYLGLREHFRGSVDHLQIMPVDEPVSGSELRRHYLVLFDGVPGGTGYLAELLSSPDALHDMLSAARRVLNACKCESQGRDGCYRCLLAYRSNHRQADTKRSSALETLDLVLAAWPTLEKLEPGDTLDHTKVNRFFDSELERRFIDVLANQPGCAMDRREVNNKDGYELTIRRAAAAGVGGQSLRWSIELQVDLDEAEGVAVASRPDMVFRCLSSAGEHLRPIAVFLDGFEFHSDIQADDTAKRYAILRAGGYHVWTFGWRDMPASDDRREPELGSWFSQPFDRTMANRIYDKAAEELGISSFAGQPIETSQRPFQQWLYLLSDPMAATRDYTNWAFSRAFGMLDPNASKDSSSLHQQVGSWLPAAWQQDNLKQENTLLGHRELEGVPSVDAVVCLHKDGLKLLNDQVALAKAAASRVEDSASMDRPTLVQSETSESATTDLDAFAHPLAGLPMAVVLRLDDGVTDAEDYQRQWRRFWAAANLLQYLPEFMPVSRSGIEGLRYAPIIEDTDSLRPTTDASLLSSDDDDWQAMIEITVCTEALSSLANRDLPPPDDVGGEIQHDEEVIALLEWSWSEQRVGLLLTDSDPELKALQKLGWHVITDVESASLDSLATWLKEGTTA